MQSEHNNIDFVIMWVDGSDPNWIREKLSYQLNSDVPDALVADSAKCFRDMGTLKYWFRSVDKFAPWVRKVHFVTWGHVPEWLNTECSKINIVNHKEFMPDGSLPTFNSRALEINLHRINELCEHFVYFNDDTFLLKSVDPADFFENDLPKDCAILSPVLPKRYGTAAIQMNNLEIINDYFDGPKCIQEHKGKWLNRLYGKYLIRTMILMKFQYIPGIYEPHLPVSYKKSTFEKVWSLEEPLLKSTSNSKFKQKDNINQWLMREWQLASGDFIPRSPKFGRFYDLSWNLDDACRAIQDQTASLVCLNDSSDIKDFDYVERKLIESFEKILPRKSQFEK